jgi:predicted Fe-Mo cluster-binding NifX family protein
MKLCIPATGPDLGAAVDARFGRAACFVLVEAETGRLLASAPNAQDAQAPSGAGIQAGQTIADLGAEAVLCANVGPKAFRVLRAAGVKVYTGAEGSVAEAVAAFREGRLAEATAANVEGHWA